MFHWMTLPQFAFGAFVLLLRRCWCIVTLKFHRQYEDPILVISQVSQGTNWGLFNSRNERAALEGSRWSTGHAVSSNICLFLLYMLYTPCLGCWLELHSTPVSQVRLPFPWDLESQHQWRMPRCFINVSHEDKVYPKQVVPYVSELYWDVLMK